MHPFKLIVGYACRSAGFGLLASLAATWSHGASTVARELRDGEAIVGGFVVALPPDDEHVQSAKIRGDIEKWVREEQAVTDALLADFVSAPAERDGALFSALVERRVDEAVTKRDPLREYQRFQLLACVLRSREQFGKAEVIARVLLERLRHARKTVHSAEISEQLLLLEVELHESILVDFDAAADAMAGWELDYGSGSPELTARRTRTTARRQQQEEIAAASAALRERLEIEKEEDAKAGR